MKWILLILTMIAALITPAFALTSSACIDANTLEMNTTITVDGASSTINEQIYCPYGCSNMQCSSAATLNSTSAIIFLLIFGVLLLAGSYMENLLLVGFSGVVGILIGLSMWIQGILISDILIKNTYSETIGLFFTLISLYLLTGSITDLLRQKRQLE